MYELKDFENPGEMLAYLNNLPNHQVVSMFIDGNGWWKVVYKTIKMGPKPKVDNAKS